MINGQYIYEAQVWKIGNNNGQTYMWSNSYPLADVKDWQQHLAHETIHNLCLAESSLYFTDTIVMGGVIWKYNGSGHDTIQDTVHAFSNWDNGGRPIVEGDPRVPWVWALKVARDVPVGKRGRFVYRNCLQTSDTVPYKENDYALNWIEDYGHHNFNLFQAWIRQVEYAHAVFRRYDETQFPFNVSPVSNIRVSSLIKLQSILDAQKRKTPTSRYYKVVAENTLYTAFQAVRQVQADALYYTGDMPYGAILNWIAPISAVKGSLIQLQDYWESAADPVVMENWRPTAGHDPYLIVGQNHWTQALAIATALENQLLGWIANEDEPVPYAQVVDFRKALSFMVYHCAGILVARFTGKPVPIWGVV